MARLPPEPTGADLALVQYTSGSVSEPKGVLLTHANILANLEMLRAAFAVGPIHAADVETTVAACHPGFGDVGAAFGWVIGKAEHVVLIHEARRGSAPRPGGAAARRP